ncbi:MAG: hypothetical protein K2X43_09700 [Hyphomonadaceae bacterium]|nr:hypothetical protein [Hyphomonadaceae bacterium]
MNYAAISRLSMLHSVFAAFILGAGAAIAGSGAAAILIDLLHSNKRALVEQYIEPVAWAAGLIAVVLNVLMLVVSARR